MLIRLKKYCKDAGVRLTHAALPAARRGDLDLLKYLVDVKGMGCDDTIRDDYGMTCTMLAARGNWRTHKGHMDVLKYLVEEKGMGYGDTIRDNDGMTCTMLAAKGGYFGKGHLDGLRYLVDMKGAGCGDNIRNNDGMTCTMIAAGRGHLDVLKYLVEEKGARYDDDLRDKNGMTCTLHSVSSGDFGVVKYLVREGGSLRIRNNDGENGYEMALSMDWDLVEDLAAPALREEGDDSGKRSRGKRSWGNPAKKHNRVENGNHGDGEEEPDMGVLDSDDDLMIC